MRVRRYDNYEVLADGSVIGARGKKLKVDKNTGGYDRVTLSRDGKSKRIFVHRIVALHYVDNPNGYHYVNHKNGIRDDNRAENLEWVTASQNCIDGFQRGRIHPLTNERARKYFDD